MSRVLVRLVVERLEDGEVRGVLAPRRLPVGGLVRVERADAAGLGIVQADAVSDPAVRVHGHGEQVPALPPREPGDVAETHRSAAGEIAHERIRAGGLGVPGRVAAQRQVPAIVGEGEGLHRADILPRTRPQVEKPDGVAGRLPLLAQLVAHVR